MNRLKPFGKTSMELATCEKCGRVLHESFWLQSGDSIYCPACRMPATNAYAQTLLPSSSLKKSVVSITGCEQLAERRLA